MQTHVLATKLFVPPPRSELVPRPRLIERLDEGAKGRLTLLSAPAGFGKTTLVSSWSAESSMPVAWLSLDEEDREPIRFLQHIVWALKGIADELGDEASAILESPQAPPLNPLLADLVNEFTALEKDVVLVLDDYHATATKAVDEVISFLLERLPTRIHLVMTTREDPDLPLARLRARGQMVELRATDLRFTVEETGAFLNEVMGLLLTADEIAALEARTEGWITALQLAALSMRGRDDIASFVRSFAGVNRHVFDFLVQEVLRRQPEAVRDFLIQTSVLRRLSAPLCNALTGRDDGSEMLAELERANLFVTPLDDERRWYRYHALFADVLSVELERQRGSMLPELHRRASVWHEAHELTGDAIRHAVAAGEGGRAAELVERAWLRMDREFQTRTWTGWARSLPTGVVRARPVLAVGVAWARLGTGDLDGAEEMLDIAEQRIDELETAVAAGIPHEHVADPVAFQALPARIAAARAYRAQALGDGVASEQFARAAISLAPEGDPGSRGIPAGLLGVAQWSRGELEAALTSLRSAMANFRALGDASASLSFAFGIADILVAQGRLREAFESYREQLRYAEDQGQRSLPGLAELHVGLAELLLERGERAEAENHMRTAETLGDRAVLPGDEARIAACRGRLMLALGNPEEALHHLDKADQLFVTSPVPLIRPPDATRVRAWLALGRLGEARSWVREKWTEGSAEPSYVDEYALLTVGRVLVADYRDSGSERCLEDALGLLAAIVRSAEAGGRRGTVIEALVLQALSESARGDEQAATASLSRALELAEPEGYIAVFVKEGGALGRLLRPASREGRSMKYARQLLEGLRAALAVPATVSREVEPIGDRELDVLRMLRSDLTGPQIARELGMSVHTLRTHTKNIYSKLYVHGRRAAVKRAEDLDIL